MRLLLKRGIAFLLAITMCVGFFSVCSFADESDSESWWNTFTGKLDDTATGLVDAAGSAIDSAKQAISELSLPDFKEGWNTASSFFGTTVASLGGQAYVDAVASSISDLQTNINLRAQQAGSSIASKAGFVAEEWHAGTFNIDAVAKGAEQRAATPQTNYLGGADVVVGDEMEASLKYYATAADSAKQQARITEDAQGLFGKYADSGLSDQLTFDEWLDNTNIDLDDYSDLYWEYYQDQIRIIPSDQYDDAIDFLNRAIAKEASKDSPNRQAMEVSYRDTLENLADRLQSSDGTESIPLSKAEAEAIAKAGVDNEFKPSDFGVTTSTAINGSYIAKQAVRAGATSAIIETALVIGPEIYEIIKYLIETGEIDSEQLKSVGIEGLSAAADGYLKGSISNALVIMCNAGKLGAAYKNASPELIGTLTVLVIDAIKYGIMMANGKISTEQYADIMAEELIVSVAALGTAALVSLLFPGATLAICLGSFVGGLVASAGYTTAKTVVLAVVDTAGVDMLVPVQNTAESLKGKVSVVTEKISDSLSGMSGIDFSSIKDKTIEVFDFTAA